MKLKEMRENNFIYVGPSWAALSYPETDTPITNLLEQWKLSAINYSKRGARNLDFIRQPCYTIDRPCVWLFCEPLVEIFKGVKNPQWDDRDYEKINQYLTVENHREFHQILKREQLIQMNSLGYPIGLIGAHCDVNETDIEGLNNLKIIHPSWQQWMKSQIEITNNSMNFGAEVANNIMVESSKKPNEILVNDIWDQYEVWKKLEEGDLFWKTHPNKRSNIMFAEHTKNLVLNFLREVL